MFENKKFNLFIIGAVLSVIAICLMAVGYWIMNSGKLGQIKEPAGPSTSVDLSGERIYYLGILPLRNPSTMLERFAGVEQYLREQTGLNIKLRIYPTSGAVGGYTAVVRDITEGKIDFAFLAPVTSVQAHAVNPAVHVFACAQKLGSPIYYGHIVVKTSSPYRRIEDLRGKAVCGTSMSSTSGNLMPTAMLLEKGIDKDKYFNPFEFLGSHDKASEAVLAGIMEAAFINETTFDKYKGRGLRSIWKHSAVPEFNFNVNTEKVTSEELVKIKNVLLIMHETALEHIKAVDPKYDRWVEIKSDDYIGIKEALDKVHGSVFYDLDKWGK